MFKNNKTPKRKIVVKTRITAEEYTGFTERAKSCIISQSGFPSDNRERGYQAYHYVFIGQLKVSFSHRTTDHTVQKTVEI